MVRLSGPPGPIPLTASMAVVSGWLDDPAPGMVTAQAPDALPPGTAGAVAISADGVISGHDDARRPWALSPPQQVPDRGGDGVILLEVRLLDDQLGDRLVRACRPGTAVRLGRSELTLAAGPELLEHTDWDVLRKWSGDRAWQLRVTSPATFRSRNRTSPWADPVTVARGLLRRWKALHERTAPGTVDGGARSVWVSDLDGQSEVAILRGRVVSGYVGRLRYVADGPAEEAEAFAALMNFAAFAGIGSHTTYGFGTVVPEHTWQPPTTRPRSRR